MRSVVGQSFFYAFFSDLKYSSNAKVTIVDIDKPLFLACSLSSSFNPGDRVTVILSFFSSITNPPLFSNTKLSYYHTLYNSNMIFLKNGAQM